MTSTSPPATSGGWLGLDEVRERWSESLGIDDVILIDLIAAAREQCAAYAGTPPTPVGPAAGGILFDSDGVPYIADPVSSGGTVGESIPANWRLAHLMQTQALWKSASAGPGDAIGPDGLTVTVFPMDRVVKRLLRPLRGVPVVA